MASPPQEFGPQSEVVIGKRHLEQQDDAHFAGAIEDARVYDVALPAGQIAALKPHQPSDPKPIAWWDFGDGSSIAVKLTWARRGLGGLQQIKSIWS